jgi:hypothetical protein
MRSSLRGGLSAAIPLGAALFVVAGSGWEAAGHPSALVRSTVTSRIFLLETALTLVAAPVVGVFAISSAFDRWTVARRLTAFVTIVATTAAAIALVLRAPAEVGTLAAAHAVLWTAALTLCALGALCATLFREPLDAIACALGIALLSNVGVFVLGPLLEAVPKRAVDIVLLANPFVAAAASFGIDIFRTDPLYQLSPLAHTQIDYPTTVTTLSSYGLAAVTLLLGAARQWGRIENLRLIERMSA